MHGCDAHSSPDDSSARQQGPKASRDRVVEARRDVGRRARDTRTWKQKIGQKQQIQYGYLLVYSESRAKKERERKSSLPKGIRVACAAFFLEAELVAPAVAFDVCVPVLVEEPVAMLSL